MGTLYLLALFCLNGSGNKKFKLFTEKCLKISLCHSLRRKDK